MIRFIRRSVIVVGALVALVSCDFPATVSPAVEVASCAYADEKLSVAFREPQRAREYLRELRKRLKAQDSDAAREAGDLIARFIDCLPNG